MTSAAKIAANRRNARFSTGPRSLAGKMRSRRNAFRHGLAMAVTADLGFGDQIAALTAALVAETSPAGQREAAQAIAHATLGLNGLGRSRRK